jgi:hypothetical protein
MYWSEDESPEPVAVQQDVVDLLFALECRQLPVDHAYALSEALCGAHPWLAQVPGLAIHSVHVAGSQNGWERPAHGTGSLIQLSHRTKLTVRTPVERSGDLLRALPGTRIEVAGCPLTLGAGKGRPLSKETTLFARHVALDLGLDPWPDPWPDPEADRAPDQSPDRSPEWRPGLGSPGSAGPDPDPSASQGPAGDDDEAAFLAAAAQALDGLGIRVRKALCGRSARLYTPGGAVRTRSLMLAALAPEESFRLQREGLGPYRLMGCGVFIPHKGIGPAGGPR